MLVLTRMEQDPRGQRRGAARPGGAGRHHDRAVRRRGRARACCTRRTRAAAPSRPSAGNVATCAGGLRGLKYGVTRNYVLGVEAVLPTGEIIRTGGRLWKDVAGYDLTRLLTGSEGTLAVMTEVTLRAAAHARGVDGTGVAYFPDLADAGRAVSRGHRPPGSCRPRWSSSTPSASARSRSTRTSGCDTTPGRCCCSATTGTPDVVDRDLERMAQACVRGGRDGGDASPSIARRRQALLEARRCLAAGAVAAGAADHPRGRDGAAAAAGRDGRAGSTRSPQRHDVTIATFGHAGDGNLHPTSSSTPPTTGAIDRAHAAFDEIFAAAIELDGTITGEHGVGARSCAYLERPARRRPDGAAAADQGRLRPRRHPQPRKARLMSIGRHHVRDRPPSGAGIFDARPARPLHLLRLLPARLPDVRADRRRDVLAARADHLMRALETGGWTRTTIPPPDGGVVLPGLPGVRAGVPGGGAVRRSCWRSGATTSGTGRRRPLDGAAADVGGGLAAAASARFGVVRRHARPPAAMAPGPVNLMLGCFERVLYPRVSRAVRSCSPRCAAPADQGCCGALHAHNGGSSAATSWPRSWARRCPGRS